MKEMCYKLHTNEQAMDSVETVSMQSVPTGVQGGKEQNKKGSVTTRHSGWKHSQIRMG